MDNSALLYGKDPTQRVVGLEVSDAGAEIFTLNEDGSVSSEIRENKYWILNPEPEGKGWVRLKGNLHYKYGKQFKTKAEFTKARYLLKESCYSVYNAKEACMLNKGITFYKGLKPSDLPILSFDLETTGLDPNLPDAKVLLISNTFRKNGEIVRRLFAYDEYESQAEMLLAWTEFVQECDPAVITGHNIFGYDCNYLLVIAEKEQITLNIGRNGSPMTQENYEASYRVDGSRDLSYHRIGVYGRECIDTMFLAYRYDIATKKYDSYGLKNIIKQEGLEKQDRVFYDASQIRFKYTDPVEWAKIKEYCKDDSDDSLKLFDLMCPPYFYMTQSIPRTFQQVHESATGAQINGMMVRAYLQDKHSLPKADPTTAYPGALSDGFPGVYRNCLKWDISSLYPSIMRQYKIHDAEKDPQHHFLALTEYFSTERLKNKKLAKETGEKYFDDLQASQKIFANSLYGFLGTPGLLFNSIKNAALITEYGREILCKSIKWATGKDYEKRTVSNTESD